MIRIFIKASCRAYLQTNLFEYPARNDWNISHDGSMVLLYMVCHGSHQYTPVMLAYIPAPWILWVLKHNLQVVLRLQAFKQQKSRQFCRSGWAAMDQRVHYEIYALGLQNGCDAPVQQKQLHLNISMAQNNCAISTPSPSPSVQPLKVLRYPLPVKLVMSFLSLISWKAAASLKTDRCSPFALRASPASTHLLHFFRGHCAAKEPCRAGIWQFPNSARNKVVRRWWCDMDSDTDDDTSMHWPPVSWRNWLVVSQKTCCHYQPEIQMIPIELYNTLSFNID